ncbi:MAG TPA: hypothetical protein VF057_09445 [Thermoanaerobaculia bacterium]
MILELLLVTVTFKPSAPTVGDPITIDFPSAVVLNASEDYELVSQERNRVVIRTFNPKPLTLTGTVDGVEFRQLVIPVKSVLQADDNLQPAPLKPPIAPPPSRAPWYSLGGAAAAAVLAWLAVFLLARRRTEEERFVPELPAGERFRISIEQLRARSGKGRWAALADATRLYLASIEPGLGAELTTSELLRKLGATNIRPQDVVATVLRQGDLEKFSPWGARASDFDEVAARALELIPSLPAEEAA